MTNRAARAAGRIARALSRRFGVDLVRYEPPCGLSQEAFLAFCRDHLAESSSQWLQDLFVRFILEDKREGFFVEFGATDGVTLSNTLSLERQLGWRGILAEPGRCWREVLRRNRRAILDERCVWGETGSRVLFNETPEGAFSTVDAYSSRDSHAERRRGGSRYEVETVSLNDLLACYDAPNELDYLSVDTEGSELPILRAFDFERYRVDVLTIEHNYSPERGALESFIEGKGFVLLFRSLSLQDSWFVRRETLERRVGGR